MAIVKTASNVARHGWMVSATSADFSTTEELRAAPGSGVSIYLEYISINSISAITVTIGEGETTDAVTTIIVQPVLFTTGGGQYAIHFTRPIKLSAATSLTVDASAAGVVQIGAYGYEE